MKFFIIALVLAGTTLLASALFWPDSSHRAAIAKQRSQPDAASVQFSEGPVSPTNRYSEAPLQATTAPPPVVPASATSAEQLTELPPEFASTSNVPAAKPTDARPVSKGQLTADEKETIKQTSTDKTSLRDPDFPRTYISKIHVDLTSPNHSVTLTWAGPNARRHPPTSYHSSPGRGLGNNNCDDPEESCRVNSNCTPKGTFHIQAFSNTMVTSPECRFVSWFDTKRGIALHYYPNVPNYPASHGCVRLGQYAAQLIHNNSKIGATEVTIDGTWKFVR